MSSTLLSAEALIRRHKLSVDDKTVPALPLDRSHRDLDTSEFWQRIPAYRDDRRGHVPRPQLAGEEHDHRSEKLLAAVQDLVPDAFYDDVAEGFPRAPMSIRVSPYLLSLIDWSDPYNDPLRRQFMPVASRAAARSPELPLDSLHEQADAPVPGPHAPLSRQGAVPRARHAARCTAGSARAATRSASTPTCVEKVSLKATEERWEQRVPVHRERPELEDIVVSRRRQLPAQGAPDHADRQPLLEMPNIRRIRFATKGPAVMPMKLITDDEWLDALTAVVERGRKLHKEVVLHTHFNHPNEITAITKRALDRLFERGIIVRNQSVLQRGVNDDVARCSCWSSASATPGAPVLRLHARPREGRRGPAHHAADRARHREGGARRDRRLPHADLRRRRAGRRRQARRALLRALRSDHGRERVHARPRRPERALLLLRPASTSCPKKGRSAGRTRPSTKPSCARRCGRTRREATGRRGLVFSTSRLAQSCSAPWPAVALFFARLAHEV